MARPKQRAPPPVPAMAYPSASNHSQPEAGPSGSGSGSASASGTSKNQSNSGYESSELTDMDYMEVEAAPQPPNNPSTSSSSAHKLPSTPALTDGPVGTVSFSEGTLQMCIQSVRWRNLRELLEGNMVFLPNEGDQVKKEEEEEADELMDGSAGRRSECGDNPPGAEKILVHTRSLITHIQFEIKPPTGRTSPRSLDTNRIADSDERNAALKVLQIIKSRGGINAPIKVDGKFGMVMENCMRSFHKKGNVIKKAKTWPRITGCIGAHTDGEEPSGYKGLYTLHLQGPDEVEVEDAAAHGFKWEKSANKPVNHWFQALAGQVDRKGPAFSTEADVKVSMDEGEQVGLVSQCSISFHTTIRVYTTVNALLDLPDNEHLRRIVHAFFPSSNQYNPYAEANLQRAPGSDVTLSEFYAAMKPAPYPIPEVIELMQPKEMVATLKPFQKRTVAFLLANERAESIHPSLTKRSIGDAEGMWEKVEIGQASATSGAGVPELAFCRLKGRFQPITDVMQGQGKEKEKARDDELDVDMDEDVNLDRVEGEWLLPEYGLTGVGDIRGSMLCEEMGLGKTVEALAVVVLHPRDFARELAEREAAGEPDDAPPPRVIMPDPTEQQPAQKRRKIGTHVGESDEESSDDSDMEVEPVATVKPANGRTWFDKAVGANVTEVKCTLIVTPPNLLRQWIDEIAKHCPDLNYIVYTGYQDIWKDFTATLEESAGPSDGKAGKKRKYQPREDEAEEFERFYTNYTNRLKDVDVIVVSYNTLANDENVSFASEGYTLRTSTGPPRAKPRSPLAMMAYWRVIMDEVQMMKINSTKSAIMVTKLKRVNSLVLSGTPAKRTVNDLVSPLHFIGITLRGPTWDRFLKAGFRPAFEALMREVAVRHTKAAVKGEANIPPQSRYIVPIKMNEVETQYYRDLLHRNIDEMAASADGYRDTTRIRALVTTLRAICTHLQTNDLRGGGEGRQVRRPRLNRDDGKIMDDLNHALVVMQDQAWADYYSGVIELLDAKINYAIALHTDQPDQHVQAIQVLNGVAHNCDSEARKIQDVLKDIEKVVVDLDSDRMSDSDSGSEDGDSQDDDNKQDRRRHTQLKLRLTSIKTLRHEALFRQGDLHHQHQDEAGYSELEDTRYREADGVRTELLKQPLKKSNTSIERVREITARSRMRQFEKLEVETCGRMGITTEKFQHNINEFIEDALNANAECLWNLRGEVVKRLLQPVELISGKEADGKEFEITLDKQADLDAHMTAYGDALADRREMITEVTTFVQQENARKQKKRSTNTATKTATAAVALGILVEKDESTTAKELKERRQQYREGYVGKASLQSLIADLDDFLAGETHRAERELAKMEMSRLREVKDEQLMNLTLLDDEYRALTKCFNVRLFFFMTLQKISDTLVDPEAETLDMVNTLRLEGEVRKAESLEAKRRGDRLNAIEQGADGFAVRERKLAAQIAHAKYLDSLNKPAAGEEKEACPICQEPDATDKAGTAVLECGHIMCSPDYDEFLKTLGTHNCPMCRQPVRPSKVRKFGGKQGKKASERKEIASGIIPAAAEAVETAVISSELPVEALNVMTAAERADINEVQLIGSWGAKLDFLLKHLKYASRQDSKQHREDERQRMEQGLAPKPLRITKHIVFSAWADSLEIVKKAFVANGITYNSIDTKVNNKKDITNAAHLFKEGNHQVFLLHAERQVSGLTLTVATVVHMLEPVMNPGYELQAIGRVDRLGQTKPTTVYCYATTDTIESKIVNRSLAAGNCIYAKEVNDLTFHAEDTTAQATKGADTLTGDRDELLDLLL